MATERIIKKNLSSFERVRMPADRAAITHKFTIWTDKAGSDEIAGYITAGVYDDGRIGEVFLSIGKEGANLKIYESLMISVSIGLQSGIPLSVFVQKFAHVSFEPSGITNNPDIPMAKSIVDYIFRWLDKRFPGGYLGVDSK